MLCYSEVDYLYLSIGSHEYVARVDVAMYVSLVVQCHDSRQYIYGNVEGKFSAVVLCQFIKLTCIGYLLSLLVDDVAFKQVLEHHAVQEFAYYVVALAHSAVAYRLLDGDEAEHLDEVLIAYSYRCFALGAFDCSCRQVVKEEFDSYIASHSRAGVYARSLKHLAHTTYAKRLLVGVDFVVYPV